MSGFRLFELVPDAFRVNVTGVACVRSIYVPTYPSLLSVHALPAAAPLDRIASVLPLIVVCAKTGEETPPTSTKHLTNRFMKTNSSPGTAESNVAAQPLGRAARYPKTPPRKRLLKSSVKRPRVKKIPPAPAFEIR
jgi:hypothetical protein